MDDFSFDDLPELDDAKAEKRLAREIRISQGFTLIFAVCNRAEDRNRHIARFRADNPAFRIQEFALGEPVNALLDILREQLSAPPPDAVFVYGMENWISGSESPRCYSFILNLNAGRNHLYEECPCPLVLWLPEFLLRVLSEGAPDFFSIRSGLHYFSSSPGTMETTATPEILGQTEMLSLTPQEREARIQELTKLLQQIRDLPAEYNKFREQSRLLNQISLLYMAQGQFDKAEEPAKQSLEITQNALGENNADITRGWNNLASIYVEQGKYEQAIDLFKRALAVIENLSGENAAEVSNIWMNLALLYNRTDQNEEAKVAANNALIFITKAADPNSLEAAHIFANLAGLHQDMGSYERARVLSERALFLREVWHGGEHPDIAASLNSVALLDVIAGRYVEALSRFERALTITEKYLGPQHPDTVLIRENLEGLRKDIGLNG